MEWILTLALAGSAVTLPGFKTEDSCMAAMNIFIATDQALRTGEPSPSNRYEGYCQQVAEGHRPNGT